MYIVFLFLYSYILLSNYYSLENMRYAPYVTYIGLKITVFEIILIIWRFSYICIMIQPKRSKKFFRHFKHFNFAKLIQASLLIQLNYLVIYILLKIDFPQLNALFSFSIIFNINNNEIL